MDDERPHMKKKVEEKVKSLYSADTIRYGRN